MSSAKYLVEHLKEVAMLYRGRRCCLDPLNYQCCRLPHYNNALTNPLYDYVEQQTECDYAPVLKDTIVSSQEEQPYLYDVAASSIAYNKTVRR
ncbi:MAG: hypothetical protein WBQ25_13500 [Nitrososphaeraceae archaeon]